MSDIMLVRKSDLVDGITEAVLPLKARIQQLEQMLRNAREKLVLYRQAHSGNYIGGVEYTTLIRSIDAALETKVQP